MFEHLDDPAPPHFGDHFRQVVIRRAHRRRRHRRLMAGAGVALASVVVGVGALYGRAAWRARDVARVEVAGTGEVAAGEPVTVLVLGTDGRLPVGRTADVLMLVRLDPGAGALTVLSLPRDLMVDAPGGGGPVVVSRVDGGELVGVIESQIGVPVDHVVQVDIDGFRSLIDQVGGVDIRVDAPLRDTASGLHVEAAGCVSLDGEDALALVRSRRLEVLDDSGTWVRDPLADLRRIENQRQVALAALDALAEGGTDPVTLNGHVDWALDHVTVDATLGIDDMVRLARAAAALDPSAVSEASLPVVPHPADLNRFALDTERAPEVLTAFTAGRALPAAPAIDDGSASPPLVDAATVAGC